MEIKNLLKNKFLFFDGAMGTMLQKSGLKIGEIPETLNITHPEIIQSIHEQYVHAGSDIITTNTFQANELKLKNCNYSVQEIINSGVKIAKNSGAKYVALDIGPLGQLMEPMGTISFEKAYGIFKSQIKFGVEAGADLILIETISDLYEAKAAILAAKENSTLPVICTMTFQEDQRTFIGTDPLTATMVLQSLGVDALGVNCSLGPKEIIPIVKEMLTYSKIPVIVQPNAGLPRIEEGRTVYDITPQKFAEQIKLLAGMGVKIIGGCCGTTPEYIKEAKDILNHMTPVESTPKLITCACSPSKTVIFNDNITVIGERINPTGKKKLKEALKEGNFDYVLTEAIKQEKAGAQILDVNVGLPDINEAEVMKRIIFQIQEIVNLPLQIDSANAKTIEYGARIYNGKPIINSVNGNEKIMNDIFPIVKKYGASVIGLTFDENGIPSSAEERFKIAEKIINKAQVYGIPKEDILIDCLVLTASAQQKDVMETLKAVTLIKEKLGVKTLLGVSNVSFGLPNRTLINSTYLSAALFAGLDAPILNPLSSEVMGIIYAFKVLNNMDKESKKYISIYNNTNPVSMNNQPLKNNENLKDIIIEGRKDECSLLVKKLLKHKTPVDIINEYFIPALDIVGEKYEKAIIFLPQLIQSAETVKNGFEIIKDFSILKKEKTESKGKIVLATVKGDIHDIGKNIVKMLLENYGFQVIDLGKDVSTEEIINAVKKNNVKLVGLSALMTTTVKNMEDTIKALRRENLNCSIMVGGAVLTEEYAKKMGADFYGKDARESVKFATSFFQKSML